MERRFVSDEGIEWSLAYKSTIIEMLKQSVPVVSIVGLFTLHFNPQLVLASEPTVHPTTSDNLVSPQGRVVVPKTPANSVSPPETTTLPKTASPSVVTPSPATTQPTKTLYELLTKPTRLEISLSQRQVTLYHGLLKVKAYPIAVGRQGWETPLGDFQVLQMIHNPTWIHPFTGLVIPGGDPENPLGHYWIGFWTNGKNWVGFHGTPNPESVGKPASHGCIRMYGKDVEELFQKVSVGTPVKVVK